MKADILTGSTVTGAISSPGIPLMIQFTSPQTLAPVSSSQVSKYDLYDLTFSDPLFDGAFTLLSYGCASGSNACSSYHIRSGLLSNTFSGSTLTLNFNNIVAGQIYTFTQPAAVTPEPSSLIFLGTGLLGAIGLARKNTSTPRTKAGLFRFIQAHYDVCVCAHLASLVDELCLSLSSEECSAITEIHSVHPGVASSCD